MIGHAGVGSKGWDLNRSCRTRGSDHVVLWGEGWARQSEMRVAREMAGLEQSQIPQWPLGADLSEVRSYPKVSCQLNP